MEFWGVEVPAGKPLTCEPGDNSYVHVSQAALGESKNEKGSERVVLKVRVGKTDVVVGTLFQGRCDQTSLDLIFDKEFKLHHNSSSSSVYFAGYKTDAIKDEEPSASEEESEDEDDRKTVQASAKENGRAGVEENKHKKAGAKGNRLDEGAAKLTAKTETPKVEIKQDPAKSKSRLKKDEEDEDEDEDDEDEDEDDEYESGDDESDDDEDVDDEMDEDFSDDESVSDEDKLTENESEDEEPKSAKNKRRLDSAKTPVSDKKLKLATPAGAAGKSGNKTDARTPTTPFSAPKQQTPAQNAKKDSFAKKTPGKGASPQTQPGKEGAKGNTPASGKKPGQYFCQPCSRNFTTEAALTMHSAAKHK